jgi:hypothetical protein
MRNPIKLLIIAIAIIIALVLLSTVDSERPLTKIEKPVLINAQ